MSVLVQFLFRLAFGLGLGMAVTSPRLVTSGYFRVHLYVVLGLNTLAALVAWFQPEFALWPPLAGMLLSYVGSVFWLYEKPRPGRLALLLGSLVALAGAWQAIEIREDLPAAVRALIWLDAPSGGLVLGATMAAMLLGHWYLNTPTMELAPLRRLVRLVAAALVLRMMLCGTSLGLLISATGSFSTHELVLLALRWLFGLVGALVLVGMTWQTLKIPNTQSATGILYVTVIGTFLGELSSQLLSAQTGYPL